MKRVKFALVAANVLFAMVFTFTACEKSNEKKIAEVAESAEAWVKQQEAFHAKNGILGDCEQIGAKALPAKSKYFSYECEFQENVVNWVAENKIDLGKCKSGNKWKISMFIASKEYGISLELPIIVPCREITPEFFSNAKKDVSEESKKEQALAEIEKDPSTAIAELEQEAEIWLQDFGRSNSNPNPYKPIESKYFTYQARFAGTLWQERSGYFWTAASKIKMDDCPIGSVWEMSKRVKIIYDDYGDSERTDYSNISNKVPAECEAITPSVITNHK